MEPVSLKKEPSPRGKDLVIDKLAMFKQTFIWLSIFHATPPSSGETLLHGSQFKQHALKKNLKGLIQGMNMAKYMKP